MAGTGEPMVHEKFGTQRSEDDQLVVALPHLGAVAARLREVLRLGDRGLDVERDEGLGLARVKLPTGSVVYALGRKEPDPVGRLLEGLYDHFAEKQGGWTPVIGRNRTVDEVVGGGHTIGVGDEGFPDVAKNEQPLALREGDPGAGVLVGIADTVLHPNSWLEGSYQAPPAASWQPDGKPLRYE